jgi:hypothetical protein
VPDTQTYTYIIDEDTEGALKAFRKAMVAP